MDKCPMCGYNAVQTTKPNSNVMNRYANSNNPKDVCILNSNDSVVTVTKAGVSLVYNLIKRDSAPSQVTVPAPIVPTPIPIPVVPAKPAVIPPKPVVAAPVAPSAPIASTTPSQP